MRWQDSLNVFEVDLSGLPDDAWLNLNTREDFARLSAKMKLNG